MPGGKLQKSFKKVKTPEEVSNTLLEFCGDRSTVVIKQFLSRLIRMREAVENSEFFRTHEVKFFYSDFINIEFKILLNKLNI